MNPLLLIILDGFGISLEKEGNPVALAKTPALDLIERSFPFTALQASGTAVGLPWGEPGNSEVGHLTMGAGRTIYHHLPRIITAIRDESFYRNEKLLEAAEYLRAHQGRLHIAGLISSGSVHSYIDNIWALLEFAKRENLPRVFLHVFTDGKDAPPKEGAKFLADFEARLRKEYPKALIATVIGRFFALDRDRHWDRIQTTYELLTEGKGEYIPSISRYLEALYAQGITDEFIKPAVVRAAEDQPVGLIQEHDVLIFSDFREDSMRELAHAFTDSSFNEFPRRSVVPNLTVLTMTEYEKGIAASPLFFSLDIPWPLAQVLGYENKTHLHLAESQKYAHVTYFFNGGVEKPFPGEKRMLIPSLPNSHYDQVPEMKAEEITAAILANLDSSDVIIANYANADMVGHSGNLQASIRTVETLNDALGELMNAVLNCDGIMVVTADHGNIELKRSLITGEKLTEHSINPVPFYLIGNPFRRKNPRSDEEIVDQKRRVAGIVSDVAPTILELLNLPKPREMTGRSLLPILVPKEE